MEQSLSLFLAHACGHIQKSANMGMVVIEFFPGEAWWNGRIMAFNQRYLYSTGYLKSELMDESNLYNIVELLDGNDEPMIGFRSVNLIPFAGTVRYVRTDHIMDYFAIPFQLNGRCFVFILTADHEMKPPFHMQRPNGLMDSCSVKTMSG